LVTENINQNIENMDVTNNSEGGLRYVTDGHYTYTSWGHWSKPGGVYTDVNNGAGIEHKIDNSLWVVGQEIDPNDMPKSGSARYLGVAQGHYYTGDLGTTGGIYGGALNGTVDIAANFANNTVSGDLNLGKVGGGHFANASFAGASINKSHFNGSLTSSDLSPGSQHPNNSIKGSFYGPGASEVGGIFAAKNTNGEFATGTFAGKK
jgi:hypothetical protein